MPSCQRRSSPGRREQDRQRIAQLWNKVEGIPANEVKRMFREAKAEEEVCVTHQTEKRLDSNELTSKENLELLAYLLEGKEE